MRSADGDPRPRGADADLQRWDVPAALHGERLDRAVSLVTGLSRSEVDRLIAGGCVRVGRKVVTTRSHRVRTGDAVVLDGASGAGRPPVLVPDPAVDVPVVYEDDDLIVVDKPAGLVVHPGAGNREGTLVQGLLARYPDVAALAVADRTDRPGVVHRLDKGTSGLLVVARNEDARASLVAQLADRSMGREYLALVEGDLDSEAGVIEAPLGRSDRDPTRIRVQMGGRAARTRYEVEDRLGGSPPMTLIRCRLETGRTHQIRVHLSSIGHPVAGDIRYGGHPVPGLGPDRPFLHAARLELDHPKTGRRLRFESALPADLRAVLDSRAADA